MFDKGIRIEDMDLLIAATPIYNELTLVTNNTKHFENVPNLKIENWKKQTRKLNLSPHPQKNPPCPAQARQGVLVFKVRLLLKPASSTG